MTEAERKTIADLRTFAAENNMNLGKVWREVRKGAQFIHGRQLKFLVSTSCKIDDREAEWQAHRDFAAAVTKKFGYICDIRVNQTYRASHRGRPHYIDFTQPTVTFAVSRDAADFVSSAMKEIMYKNLK